MTASPAIPYSAARIVGTFNSHERPDARALDWLARQAVSDGAIDSPTPIRAGRAVWVDPGRFAHEQHEPVHATGSPVLLFLVTDADGDPVDVVAWNPKIDRVGSWLGSAYALGQDATFAPRITEGLPVHRSPLRWLQSSRIGLVILRPRLAADFLADAGPLIAEDVEHGRELRTALARPGPRILIDDAVPTAHALEVV